MQYFFLSESCEDSEFSIFSENPIYSDISGISENPPPLDTTLDSHDGACYLAYTPISGPGWPTNKPWGPTPGTRGGLTILAISIYYTPQKREYISLYAYSIN